MVHERRSTGTKPRAAIELDFKKLGAIDKLHTYCIIQTIATINFIALGSVERIFHVPYLTSNVDFLPLCCSSCVFTRP